MKKKSILDLYQMRDNGEKAAWITAYDAPTASLAEQAGIDMILVGDSVGMCVYGFNGTNPMTMDIQLAHTAGVRRGAPNTFIVGDMPFLSYQISPEEAVRNAGAFIQKADADAIKLEGGRRVAKQIKAISEAGIVVFGHIGLTPQSSSALGGFKAQGLTADSAQETIADAHAVEDAGATFLLIEAVAPEVTQLIRKKLSIPVYGIGAGVHTDGELIIVADLLGIFEAFKPKFVKRYAQLAPIMKDAFSNYIKEVKDSTFPGPEHVYNMKPGELEKLQQQIK
ncbi:MAG: 3-methyl-2-oxobutanoate hydroxymethyltransferase [Planctomycetes bacterium]|nr:3-methyl-2-oxobutanoate hydroxymethyltransferase [Planctomycetota bacterium]